MIGEELDEPFAVGVRIRSRSEVTPWRTAWAIGSWDPSWLNAAPVTFSYAEQPDLDVNQEHADRWQ